MAWRLCLPVPLGPVDASYQVPSVCAQTNKKTPSVPKKPKPKPNPSQNKTKQNKTTRSYVLCILDRDFFESIVSFVDMHNLCSQATDILNHYWLTAM